MTTHATRTASLLSLNLLIDEYESAIASYTSSAWPDLVALDSRVYSALSEHHEHLRSGEAGYLAESEIQAFQDLLTRRDVARKAATAASAADRVTAGATTAPTPLPNSSSVSAGDAAVAYEEAPPPGGAVSSVSCARGPYWHRPSHCRLLHVILCGCQEKGSRAACSCIGCFPLLHHSSGWPADTCQFPCDGCSFHLLPRCAAHLCASHGLEDWRARRL